MKTNMTRTLAAAAVLSMAAVLKTAAQVVIDMPPPAPRAAAIEATSVDDATTQSTMVPAEGNVALARYAGFRTGPRSAYFNGASGWYRPRVYGHAGYGYPVGYGYGGYGFGSCGIFTNPIRFRSHGFGGSHFHHSGFNGFFGYTGSNVKVRVKF
ncbi:MAG: hypothetical protein ACR2GY_00315 [Phycisphaerales bacterium]